jgi:hypothetical protein
MEPFRRTFLAAEMEQSGRAALIGRFLAHNGPVLRLLHQDISAKSLKNSFMKGCPFRKS